MNIFQHDYELEVDNRETLTLLKPVPLPRKLASLCLDVILLYFTGIDVHDVDGVPIGTNPGDYIDTDSHRPSSRLDTNAKPGDYIDTDSHRPSSRLDTNAKPACELAAVENVESVAELYDNALHGVQVIESLISNCHLISMDTRDELISKLMKLACSPPNIHHSLTSEYIFFRKSYLDSLLTDGGMFRVLNLSHCDFNNYDKKLKRTMNLMKFDTCSNCALSGDSKGVKQCEEELMCVFNEIWGRMLLLETNSHPLITINLSHSSYNSLIYNLFSSLKVTMSSTVLEESIKSTNIGCDDVTGGGDSGVYMGSAMRSIYRTPSTIDCLLHLNLSHNHDLTDSMFSLLPTYCTNIQILNISHCSCLTSESVWSISNGNVLFQYNLKTLDMSYNEMDAESLMSFNAEPNLSLGGACHASNGLKLKQLTSLLLGYIQIDDGFELHLAPIENRHGRAHVNIIQNGENSEEEREFEFEVEVMPEGLDVSNVFSWKILDFSTIHTLEYECIWRMLPFTIIKGLEVFKLTDVRIDDKLLHSMFGFNVEHYTEAVNVVGSESDGVSTIPNIHSSVSKIQKLQDYLRDNHTYAEGFEEIASLTQPLPLRSLDMSWCEELTSNSLTYLFYHICGCGIASGDMATSPGDDNAADPFSAWYGSGVHGDASYRKNVGTTSNLSSIVLRATTADSTTITAITHTCYVNLTELNVCRCADINTVSVAELGKRCKKLKHLDIAWSLVGDEAVESILGNCADIEILVLQGCKHLTANLIIPPTRSDGHSGSSGNDTFVTTSNLIKHAGMVDDTKTADVLSERIMEVGTGTGAGFQMGCLLDTKQYPCTQLRFIDFSWVNMFSKTHAILISKTRNGLNIADYYSQLYKNGVIIADYI